MAEVLHQAVAHVDHRVRDARPASTPAAARRTGTRRPARRAARASSARTAAPGRAERPGDADVVARRARRRASTTRPGASPTSVDGDRQARRRGEVAADERRARAPRVGGEAARSTPSRTATGSRGGASRRRSAASGRPPIAATSLSVHREARAGRARAGDTQPRRKCTPSTSASVVSSSGRAAGRDDGGVVARADQRRGRGRATAVSRRAARAIQRVLADVAQPSRTDAPRQPSISLTFSRKLFDSGCTSSPEMRANSSSSSRWRGGELARRLDDDAHELVAAPVAVQVGHALAPQAEDVARLRARPGSSACACPSSVGTSISAPSAACAKLIGTSQTTSLPSRAKSGCSRDLEDDVEVARPGRRCRRASPSPRSFRREPVSTPAGILHAERVRAPRARRRRRTSAHGSR